MQLIRPIRSDKRSSRAGRALALVEVIAAIVLLSTVACGLLMAHSRSLHNLAEYAVREEASMVARELIQQWRLANIDMTVPDAGAVDGDPSWSWERRIGTTTSRVERGEWVYVQLDLVYLDGARTRRTAVGFEWVEERRDVEK